MERLTTHRDHRLYDALLAAVVKQFQSFEVARRTLFQTNCGGELWDIYLKWFPEQHRQYYNCSACRGFIRRYGGVVAISEDGRAVPAFWPKDGGADKDMPLLYSPPLNALYRRVREAAVIGPFYTTKTIWGLPANMDKAGQWWTHLAAKPNPALLYRERALNAGQAMAAARQDFQTVARALGELSAPALDEALRIFKAGAVRQSERFVAPVQWLRDLHDRPKGTRGDNVLWLKTATAPAGFCHPKSSVVAPLLDDIVAGVPFAEIKRKFEAMVSPLTYQRPQAAPKRQNVAQASALAEKLGIKLSLERRFATLDDVQVSWRPTAPTKQPLDAGVFDHLKSRGVKSAVPPIDLPISRMTWAKFVRDVLPQATSIDVLVPAHGPFIALTTAEHPEAPPIIKWDHDDDDVSGRNPVAWYVYPHGSSAAQWRLTGGEWRRVTAVVLLPSLWGSRPMPHEGTGAVLLLDGAVDTNDLVGNSLFPQFLKQEWHQYRSTIEAYARSAVLHGREAASACGYDLRKNDKTMNCTLRARCNDCWQRYLIDRWE